MEAETPVVQTPLAVVVSAPGPLFGAPHVFSKGRG